jgi:UDP-GlcNAc:undecaprenyl-phosphate GlcNAc-1-phosphate transferase
MYFLLMKVFLSTFAVGLLIQKCNLRLALRFGLLDIPNARRKHPVPTPITGGVGVLLTWVCGLYFTYLMNPSWVLNQRTSLTYIACGAGALVVLGLIDDLKGLSPRWKIGIEVIIASLILAFEPQIHSLAIRWSSVFGPFVWVMGVFWIVGITNSINLIDGLDGLAAGASTLVLVSISFLSLTFDAPYARLPLLISIPLIGALFSFLRYNWTRAAMFLGDNGSLPIGFLIATSSLLCRSQSHSWVMIASIVLMLGYPILDMGLAVRRRYHKGFPLFKADRNHLHYRIQRLGLTVEQTVILLLNIGLLLQFAAICINFMVPSYAAFALGATFCCIFFLLHLIKSIESDRIRRISAYTLRPQVKARYFPTPHGSHIPYPSIHIELESLFEAGLLEEKTRYQGLIEALYLLIASRVDRLDVIEVSHQEIVVFVVQQQSRKDILLLAEKLKLIIHQFLELYELQCSLASLPVRVQDDLRLVSLTFVRTKNFWTRRTYRN